MALRDVLLRISGDSSGARKAVNETKAALKDVDGTTAEADVVVNGVEAVTARIDELRGRLDKVDHTTATAKVKLDTAVAAAELDKFEARLYRALTIEDPGRRNVALSGLFGSLSSGLDRVERRTHSFTQDLQKTQRASSSAFLGIGDAAKTAAGFAETGLNAIGDGLVGLTRGIPVIGNITAGLGGIAGGGLIAIPIIALLTAAFVGLVSILTALASVVAGAIAGAAALAVAFGAIAAPVALLAVGALAKLAKSLLGSKDASAKAQSASESLAQAHRTQAQASSALADAQRNASEQRVAALQDERAAIQAVAQADLDRERAAESRVSSRLDLRQARLDLKNLREQNGTAGATSSPLFAKLTNLAVDPSTIPGALKGLKLSGGGGKSEEQQQIDLLRAIERVREAKTGVKAADLQAKTAATAYATAVAKQNQYAREGLKAYKPYADALRQTAKAQDALATATERTNKAQRAARAARANETGATTGIGGTIKAFTGAVGTAINPGVDAIFAGASKGLGSIAAVLPGLRGGFTALGSAIGAGLATLGKLFSSPLFVSSFKTFTTTAAQLVRNVATPAVGNFATLLLKIANAALPHLRDGLTELGRKFGVFTQGATKGDRVKRVVDDIYDSFKSVVNFAGAVLGAIVAIFSGGQKSGRKLLDRLTEIINKFTAGLGTPEGKKKLESFFKRGLKLARDFKVFITDVLVPAVQKLADTLGPVLDLMKKLIDASGTVFGTFGKQNQTLGSGTKLIKQAQEIAPAARAGGYDATGHRVNESEAKKNLALLRTLLRALAKLTGDKGSLREIAVKYGIDAPPGLAQGGVVTRSLFANVGEGPDHEAVIPLRKDVLAGIGDRIVASLSIPMPAVGPWAPAIGGAIDNSRSYGGHQITYAPQYHAQVDNQQHHEFTAARVFEQLVQGL
jgi:hypothetical protein